MAKYLLIIIILFSLVAGAYFASSTPNSQAAASDWTLTWSSDSYVPPGYEGKALPARGGLIKVHALPVKKLTTNPDFLYYRWLLDGKLVYSAQGQGKSTLSFRATKWGGDSYEVACQILDSQDNVLWRSSLAIRVASPQVLLKLEDSSYALKNSLLAKTGENLTLIALPFFFRAADLAGLSFSWQLDSATLASPDEKNPDQLTIKIPAAALPESVFKTLSLAVKNKLDQLQQFALELIIEIK